MKFLASNYKLRSDLENEVRNKIGLTADRKPDHTIEGTREDLASLQLSDTTIFWGIRCIITDTPTTAVTETSADRGPQADASGININQDSQE